MATTDLEAEKRSEIAEEWYETVKVKCSDHIKSSAERAVIFDRSSSLKQLTKSHISLELVPGTMTAGLNIARQKGNKMCVLNPSSYKSPGAGFIGGIANEETYLCSVSSLYPTLRCLTSAYYNRNKLELNRGLRVNRALYTPDIMFFDASYMYKADVLSCSPPSYNISNRNGVKRDEYTSVLESRINFIYQIVAKLGFEVLVIGSWGCGSIINDSASAAKFFVENAGKSGCKCIIFAISDKYTSVYNDFDEAIKNASKAGIKSLSFG